MTVALVHGNPESAAVWDPLVAELARAGVDDVVRLSPPGFGVPLPAGFSATVTGYRDWLIGELERFDRPVDLVGHDWGGAHVVQIAMRRPDLVRSWASDALGVYAPDYVWHPMAQLWQQEGAGEESVKQLFGGSLDERLAVVDDALQGRAAHALDARGEEGVEARARVLLARVERERVGLGGCQVVAHDSAAAACGLRLRTTRVMRAAKKTTRLMSCEVERPVSVVRPRMSPRGSSRKNSMVKRVRP